jgi:hypothetical protein
VLKDLLGVLIGHETAADLGVRMRRNDRLWPFAFEAAPYAVDVQCRPHAQALENGIARFADEGRHA